MNTIAALPMYDWPETRDAVEGFYRVLRAQVPDLPDDLTRPLTTVALYDLWRDPALVFAQTCWGPMHAGLAAYVDVLAQPSYDDVIGGAGPYYRSAIVMRAGRPCAVPDRDVALLPDGLTDLRLAINGPESLSGVLALAQDTGMPDLAARAVVTGSHRASVQAVAAGQADWAAIDCRSWALAGLHEPAARALTIVGWTAPRLGLPFVTSRTTPLALKNKLTYALRFLGAHPPLQEVP